VLLNDSFPKIDQKKNGAFYAKETIETGVVYQAFNLKEGKSYIGRVSSYEKHGDHPMTRYGAKGRFRRHWSNKDSDLAYDECPIFYDVLRRSDLEDWFIFTLKVCSLKHLKEYETRLTKLYNTSDPEYGYNYFVGDNKPNSSEHLKKYQSAKAKSNADRAVGGGLRQKEHSKNLPPNINYRKTIKDGIVVSEGYFVQIKINGKLYNKAFLSKFDTMETKLDQAKAQLDEFKKNASKTQAIAKKDSKKKIIKSGSKSLKSNRK